MPRPLSQPLKVERHERFCHAYVVSFHGRNAAVEAGYSESSAPVMACQLMKKKSVRRRLKELQAEFFAAKKLEREEVLQQLYWLCTRDVLDFADKDTGTINVDDLRRLPKNLRASIDALKVRQLYDKQGEVIGQEITLTLSPKAKAVELAMKHFSLFAPDKGELKVTGAIDWDVLFQSQREKDPEVESLIEELPQGGTQLIIREKKVDRDHN